MILMIYCSTTKVGHPKWPSTKLKNYSNLNHKNKMRLSETLGCIATIFFTVCYIPQIIKTAKTKTVEGLSFLLLFIQFIANIIALWYATLINQSPLVVKYILGLLFLAICITLYIKVKLNH